MRYETNEPKSRLRIYVAKLEAKLRYAGREVRELRHNLRRAELEREGLRAELTELKMLRERELREARESYRG